MGIFAKIQSIAYALPENIQDNEFLVKDMTMDWTAEDIFSKTGIHARHIALEAQRASDIALVAAEKLFENNAGLREKIDYIIFCSQSPDYVLPATACLLQTRLELREKCGAFDINQGCSGFIYGLSIAKGVIESGQAQNVLLLNAETYSKYLDKADKTTRTIFGDGAAASWLTAETSERAFIDGFEFGTNGQGANNLIVQKDRSLFMDGPEIFQFTLQVVPKTVKGILQRAGMVAEEVDYFVFHQANMFILEHLRKKLKIPAEKFVTDMEDIGNTVSASIPIAIKRAKDRGTLVPGNIVLAVGFGVGYSWGGCLIKL